VSSLLGMALGLSIVHSRMVIVRFFFILFLVHMEHFYMK
jgi:hypothetical protein